MEKKISELDYPIDFRSPDAETLGSHLLHRHNVNLIGMKRVGISNFLRFFLYRPDIVTAYISKKEKHLFIPVDLNDLIEREVYPFWTLTLKRIIDTVERSVLPGVDREKLERWFDDSIQAQDLFLVIESVRKSLIEILDSDVYPTIFFLRFDRMGDVINQSFFDNLQGLKDATHQKLSYVFTGYQSLDSLSPNVFTKASLSVFMHPQFIKPAKIGDIEVIYNEFKDHYGLSLSEELEKKLFSLSGGHVQYLQISMILLNELSKKPKPDALEKLLLEDERIQLQSDELWDGLSKQEKETLLNIVSERKVDSKERQKASYLWDVGIINAPEKPESVFSSLYKDYLLGLKQDSSQQNGNVHFTKKEHLLFTFLEKNLNEICERDDIVEFVWPEYSEYGVSDWAIDRLVARVRAKLKRQGSEYEIQTIRTRGYKLIAG